MSIVTKGGDEGMTSLMYGRRVSKCDPRVEAYGTVDELNSALGLARAASDDGALRSEIETLQKELVLVMGELATAPEDLPRYKKDGFSLVSEEFVRRLDAMVEALETKGVRFAGWATPGATTAAAALDMARSICRRAERGVCALNEAGRLQNPHHIVYLNRLSDLLWLMARTVETPP